MMRRNQFGSLIVAGLLIGLAGVAVAPRLYGGGDEGVDILPNVNGRSSPTGGGSSAGDGPVMIGVHGSGYVAIHGKNLDLDTVDWPLASGFLAVGRTRADIFQGLPGQEPGPNPTAVDILTKGTRKLQFSDSTQLPGASAVSYLHFNGRFEVEDIDPNDLDGLEIMSRGRAPAVMNVLLGHRSTHAGGVPGSFAVIDQVVSENVPSGTVDLNARRSAMKAALAGTGYDVGLALYATTPKGVDEVWVAFNVDDQRAVYDIDVRLK